MILRKLLSLLLVFSLTLSSCSVLPPFGHRTIASYSSDEVQNLRYLLAVDRFHYYLTELTEFKKGKVSQDLIDALVGLTPEKIMQLDLSYQELSDPKQYDQLSTKAINTAYPDVGAKKKDLEWGYNFFKNKLSDSFLIDELSESEAQVADNPKIGLSEKKATELEPKVLSVEDQTLEAEHYISNRTTRGIFWEAQESGRGVEFHLSDPREFKQNVAFRNGEIIGEIKTISSNYNKIFIVQYPGEDSFRYAITNVGGVDRMEHLMSSLSLSKSGISQLSNKVEVFGDIESFHKSIQRRLENMLEHLPKADRLIIGQKAGIETYFYTYWKVLALKNIYDSNASLLEDVIEEKDLQKLKALIDDPTSFDLGKHKGLLDKSYQKVKKTVETDYPNLLPQRFKQFDFDNFLASISDLEFTDSSGNPVRWRLVSNVWGDELYPIASALKNTGHDKVVYSGTAGALPNKGLKVGDMVTPAVIKADEGEVYDLSKAEFNVEGSKTGPTLGHVGSPFDETTEWLSKSIDDGIDLVEIEGKYLARVFGEENISLYLMVSDVINSDGETLAHASSSKRKAMLQSFIKTMADKDSKGLIQEASVQGNKLTQIRAIVEEAIGGKGDVFKHLMISRYLDQGYVPSVDDVLKDADEIPTFSDNFFHTKLTGPSSTLTQVFAEIEGDKPDIGISRSFLEGSFNPKEDKLQVNLLAIGPNQRENIEAALEKYSSELSDVDDIFEIKVVDEFLPDDKIVQIAAPETIDSDVLFKMYSYFALKKTGLDYSVTNSANVTFKFLPTNVTENVCDISAKNFCATAFFSPGKKVRELAASFRNLFKNTKFNKKFDEFVGQMNKGQGVYFDSTALKYEVRREMVKTLPNGSLAQIVPDFDENKGLIIKVQFTEEGWKRPEVVLEEYGHLQQIMGKKSKELFHDPFHWAALSVNAQRGSNRSKEVLARAESDVLSLIKSLTNELQVSSSLVDEYLEARQAEVDQLQDSIEKEIKIENRARKKMGKQWRTVQSNLEKNNLKLDDYIAANNRKKVVELVETFLPWEEMEPTEVNAWRNWLYVMEKPASDYAADEKVVLFRGLADDLVRESDDGGHFLMSSMLTKNQGSYTRRLRSLKTYRDKLASKASNYPYEVTSIINSLKGHSVEPLGSPFISLSYGSKAMQFSGTQRNVAAMAIPRERLIDNLISGFTSEREQLVPLILFPDEILAVETGSSQSQIEETASEILGRKLTAYEKGTPGRLDPLEASKNYWNFISKAPQNAPKGGSCVDTLTKLFQGM